MRERERHARVDLHVTPCSIRKSISDIRLPLFLDKKMSRPNHRNDRYVAQCCLTIVYEAAEGLVHVDLNGKQRTPDDIYLF